MGWEGEREKSEEREGTGEGSEGVRKESDKPSLQILDPLLL